MYMHFNYTKILCLLVPLIVSPPLARAANLVVESGVMTVIGQMPISGRVLDADGNPIVGATITNLRNQKATQTDGDGNFSIDGVIGDQLSASFIGFTELTTTVKDPKGLLLTLDYSDN